MATKKQRNDLAEKVAKHADLNVNVVLRTIYALQALGFEVSESTKIEKARFVNTSDAVNSE